jgi:hypothetical protein
MTKTLLCMLKKSMVSETKMTEIHDYVNKRGEKYHILKDESGKIVVRKSTGGIVLQALRGWSLEQTMKWLEL